MKKCPHISSFFVKKNYLFVFTLLLLSPRLQAGQIIKAFVDQQDEHFLINLVMQIEAPKEKVYQLITDYAHLEQLSDSIKSSQILKQTTPTETQVKSVSEGCILFICQTITQVQYVHQLDNGYIHIEVEPTLSDLKLNNQLWHIEAIDNNRTLIHYSADIVPDFWIPPLIGGWLFQSKLLEEATNLINKVEKIANPTLTAPNQDLYTQDPDTQNPDIQNPETQDKDIHEQENTEESED